MPTSTSSLQITYQPISDIVAYAKNARTHSPDQITQLANAISEFGWTNPILVDEHNTIIAGHGRLDAAKQLRLTAIPTIQLAGLTPPQKRALRLADNKLALNAGWDPELLRLELSNLQFDGFNLSLTGFAELELADLLTPRTQGLTDPDEVPPTPPQPVTIPGDLWILGPHRLICGDATNPHHVAKALNNTAPHLMVTDPPYGVDYDPSWRAIAGVNHNPHKQGPVTNDTRTDWTPAWRLAPASVAYVWHAGRHASDVQKSLEIAHFEIRSQIIWAKDRFALSRGNYHWQHEPCWYAVRTSAHWAGDRTQSTLWTIPARDDHGHGHSTQKPVECMRRPITNNSSPGQAVYDPFLGSGTTIIAAEQSARTAITIEINPTYCDVSIIRWQNFTGSTAHLEATGQSFAQVQEERLNALQANPETQPEDQPALL